MIARSVLAVAAWCAAAVFLPPAARADTESAPAPTPSPTPSRWQWSITPYVWLPTINADLRFDQSSIRTGVLPASPATLPSGATVTIGPNNYLSDLNSALMVSAEARYGSDSVFTDVIYLNMSTNKAAVNTITGPGGNVLVPINVSTGTHLRSTIWTLAVSTSLIGSPGPSTLEGLFGFRNVNMNASADWTLAGPLGNLQRAGGAEKAETIFTPVAGIRGKAQLGKHWYVPYYGDYGASGAFETWQGILGFGYAYRTGAVILAWRQLNYYQTGNPGALIQNSRFGGPALGWRFIL